MLNSRSIERAGPSGEQIGRYPRSYYAATLWPAPLGDTGAAPAIESSATPAIDGDVATDFCIVGGGFTGLGAALALARMGRSVHLVEAGPIGWGASGRNGGQVHIGWNQDQRWLARQLGEPMARRLWDIALTARGFLNDVIAPATTGGDGHVNDCDFRAGQVHADHRARFVAQTHAHVAYLRDHYGHDSLRAVDRDEMRGLIASPGFYGGSIDMAGGHLNPLKLVIRLAGLARDAGAQVYAHSPVTRVARNGAGWRVTTRSGTITAGRVLMATGGYAQALIPAIDAHVLPVNSYQATTVPLDPDLAQSLIRGGYSVSDSRFVVAYFRVTTDNRLLFGGGETYGYRMPGDIAAFVRPHLERVFPQLAGVAFDHAWGGTLAITPKRLPFAAEVQPGLFTLSGYSGLGVVLAPYLGTVLGETMAGADHPAMECLRRLPSPRFPGGRWLRLPTQAAAMSFFALRDRL